MFNKKDLIDQLSGAHGGTMAYASKAEAERAVGSVLDGLCALISKDDSEGINLAGFGSFKRSTRAARAGRNPKTGETIQIPASQKVAFKMSKSLKDSLK